MVPTDTGSDSRLAVGDFVIDRADERVIGPHGPVRLGQKAYRVLLALAEQDGKLLTKDALFSSVWDGTFVGESALTSAVKELRRALGDESRTPRYIESVYGRGYRLIAPVGPAGSPAPAAPAPAATAATATESDEDGHPPLLFVAAFNDLGIQDSQPYLSAMLREEILLAMSRFRGIRLVSDPRSSAPAGSAYSKRDYQLMLTLSEHGDDVRALVRLTHLPTQAIVWGEALHLSRGSLGQDVERLVGRVAAASLRQIDSDVLRNLPAHPRSAYDLYVVNKLRMRTQKSLAEARQAAAAWEDLIRLHPDFTLAYPPLIRLYDTDFCFTGIGATGETERRRGYELAHIAIAIDPTDASLHAHKGWCHLWAGESALAREHLEQAVDLNPYHQARLIELATGFMFLDELDRAADLLERCRSLAAGTVEAPHEEEGLLHLLREEYDLACRSLALAHRAHPDDPPATGPSLLTDLYAALAAAAAGASDAGSRAAAWRSLLDARWAGPRPLDDARITQWVLFHNPFQKPERRSWLLSLLDQAMANRPPAQPRTGARARRGKPSAPGQAVPAGR